MKAYEVQRAIIERLTKTDPNNAGWLRGLLVSHIKIGDVLVAQGDLAQALTSFRDSLTIAERLTKADPNHAEWLRDLSVSHDRLGDVLLAQGHLPEALKSFRTPSPFESGWLTRTLTTSRGYGTSPSATTRLRWCCNAPVM